MIYVGTEDNKGTEYNVNFRFSARNNHLKVVKYLVEGGDIHRYNEDWLVNLEVSKYLMQMNGNRS